MKPINQKSQTLSHCVRGYFWMTLKSNELFIVLTRGTPGNPLRTPPQGSGTSKTSFITIFYVCEGSQSSRLSWSLRSWRPWRSQEQVQWPQLNPSTLPQFYNHAEEAGKQVRFEMLSNHKSHNQYGFCHIDYIWFWFWMIQRKTQKSKQRKFHLAEAIKTSRYTTRRREFRITIKNLDCQVKRA